MPIPLTLCITASRGQVRGLFRILHALRRRPLMVAELSLVAFQSTWALLCWWITQTSSKVSDFWTAANSRGMVVSTTGGKVCELACSKAVALHPEDSPDAWGEEAMHLLLPPTELLPL